MANELPEVVPITNSMPTEGWFCQTRGSARRRVTANDGTSPQPVFRVTGVPGHSHNASAVIEVDADYTRYREGELELGAEANVFADGALPVVYPAGQLVDSVLPDNADARFDRCVERCVKSIELRPENCTGNINEPTRAMAEVRTLVASKARLATLTYVEETQGWVIPQDEDDTLSPHREYAPLVSNFPDVFVDMLPGSGLGTHLTDDGEPDFPCYIEDSGADTPAAPGVPIYFTVRETAG